MLQSMLPAPASVLYELPQSSDSFTPHRQFSPPCCSVVGSPRVPRHVPMGAWGRVSSGRARGQRLPPPPCSPSPAWMTSATGLQALPPTSLVEGGREIPG